MPPLPPQTITIREKQNIKLGDHTHQIREQIRAHTGIPAKPNTSLLGKVGENKKCRFTSAEAYRAAWGDKPLPKDDRRDRRSKGREHDDD